VIGSPPPRRPLTLRDLVAYHEAGHAVVGHLLGFRLLGATIAPAGEFDGLACFDLDLHRERSPTRHRRLAATYAVGDVAMCRLWRRATGRTLEPDPPTDDGDGRLLRALAMEATMVGDDFAGPREWSAFEARARRRAARLLARRPVWRAVEALARELTARGTLDGDEAGRIIDVATRGDQRRPGRPD
jgi:hypothetical protein